MDDMIRQVALLTEILKEVQEIRASSKLEGKDEEEEVRREVGDESPANAEKRSEAPLEEAEATEIESDEEETQTEEEAIINLHNVETRQEILKEDVRLNNTPFYFDIEDGWLNLQ